MHDVFLRGNQKKGLRRQKSRKAKAGTGVDKSSGIYIESSGNMQVPASLEGPRFSENLIE